ncbi:hypothetical protein K7X08_031257 [Anisodus acutangulus]|uniref:Transcription factor CBF/NF-Y/archaeal histone domain-containing protein n=1 Tax=Anisodus acutangulus TaxID=402998 RepID=A0A9Q1RM05_9SOLA|nr:hypothetical protein K7X08_031257 [Anisodus acutangulus]
MEEETGEGTRRELLDALRVEEEFGKVYIHIASDKCQKEKRKTINGDDLIWALTTLGFEDYVEPLKAYFIRYREKRYSWSARFQYIVCL